MEKILVLNPGSTSTKIAVYEGEAPLFVESISHTAEELAPFERVTDQYNFRAALVQECMKNHGIVPEELSAIVSRGGLLAPIHAGAYEINEDMLWQLQYCPRNEHASNVGALIAYDMAKPLGIPAYIYDGVTVDELTEINQITGSPDMVRKGMGHNLNTRAAAMRYAREQGKAYKDITVIVAHLGGGISVNLHHQGRIVDFISDEEGGFSPERTGSLPMFDVIDLCYRNGNTKDSMMKLVKRQGGLLAHLGTTDAREVEKRIADGDEYAKLIYEAMALQVAKNIAKTAPSVCGKVDAILLTGGIAHSKYLTDYVAERTAFIAPMVVYPGENEMESLALGCLRVLRGQEEARAYVKVDFASK